MRQMELFDQKLNVLVTTARELTQPRQSVSNELLPGNDIAACYAVARAIKTSIERTDYSRDEMVDKINEYWGRSAAGSKADPPECLPPLTPAMFNNYLSKPSQYKIPAIYVLAIEAITGNLEVSRMLAEAQGGQLINNEEARLLTLAQVQDTIQELTRHEKELKKLTRF